MDTRLHEGVLENIRKLEHSMRVEVKIPRDEADRIVVTRLIEIRNSEANKRSDMSHFDKVLLHYLDEEEFEKYVVQKEPIEY